MIIFQDRYYFDSMSKQDRRIEVSEAVWRVIVREGPTAANP